MPVRTIQSGILPEIDTTMEQDKGLLRQHTASSSHGISFRDADTPKHCNKGEKDMNGSNPSFQSQSYPHYPPQPRGQQGVHGGHSMPNGYYRPGSSGHPQSVMESPGAPGYNNYYYPPHHNDNSSRSGYPPPHYGNQGQPPMQYNGNAQGNGNGNYPPMQYNDTNGRHPSPFHPPPPGPYNQNQISANHSMEFSRTVSTSFAESNKEQRKSQPSFHGAMLDQSDDQRDDQRDDISLGDSSWKNGLNQVASIEEDKFEARQGATTPVNRICPNLSSDVSNSTMEAKNTPTNRNLLRGLSSIPSMQEAIDLNDDKDELGDLNLCATGSCDLLFDEDLSMKRNRDPRQGTNEMRKMSPSMNFNSLSMREQRDAPPTKRNRSSSTHEERELYTAFSIESMGSFGRDTKLPDFNNVGDDSKHSLLKPPRTKEEPADRDLAGGNLSWEIKGQDSFGGGFSVSSNLTDGISGEVLGNSFSFAEDFPHPPQVNHENNAIDLEKIDPISTLNPSESIDLVRGPETLPKETFPPNSATWVSNTASQGRSYSMDAPVHHNNGPPPGPRYAAHPASNRFGMPPPYSDNRNGHGYRPPRPYGMGRPPQYLPPSFQPPPAGMAGPPMARNAPQPIYMMSSPHGLQDGMNGLKGSIKMGNNNGGSFSWSKDDDNRLQEVLKKHKNPKDWDAISKDFGAGRNAKECNERWIRYLKPGVRKGQWQDHEDAIVIEAVTTCKEQPFTRWSDLAQKLPGRVGKQIRDRWVNHLNPNINHMPFSKEDDMKLWEGHIQLGKRWVEISTKLFNSSRSENHIKNRWYSASFKKFVSNEFGPDAYVPCDKKNGKKGTSND